MFSYLLGSAGMVLIEGDWMDRDTALFIPNRREHETFEQWAARCVHVKNMRPSAPPAQKEQPK